MSHLISTVNFWLHHWAATYWILGKYSTRSPSAHRRFCQSFCVRRWFEPSQSVFPCIVRLGVLVYLTKTQYRIRKDVDLCALKIDDLFITNQRQILPLIIFPINYFHSRDLILFRHQFRRYVEHFCLSVRSVVFTMEWQLFWWFFPINTADSNVTDMNIHHIIVCFSPSSATFIEDRFCLFRTWSSTLLKNDLDSTDNSDSVSSFPMINCCGLAPLWGITTGCPVRSRGVTSFTMDNAVPSCWVFSWKKLGWDSRVFPQEVTTGCSVRSHIEVSDFHSWEDQAWLSSHFE